VFEHSRFVENPRIDLEAMNPSFLRWLCHSTKEIQVRAEGESGLKLRVLHIDHRVNFIVREFVEYYVTEDINHQHIAPYNPQQNDIIENQIGTVVATSRSMLKAKGLPEWF
jgi:transposase InsO family protein